MNRKMPITLTGILSFFILLSSTAQAQTYKERFDEVFFSDAPLSKVKPILMAWKAAQSNDPNYYVAAHNYYFQAAQEQATAIVQDPGNDPSAIAIRDSSGNVAGYAIKTISYNDSVLDISIKNIDKAMELAPKRLDMRFGKAYVLGEAQRYVEQIELIHTIIEEHDENDGEWLWSEGEAFDNSDAFVAQTIQQYLNTLLVVGGIEEPTKKLVEEMRDRFPNDPNFPNDLGVMAFYAGNLEEALEYFEEAYEDFPEDVTTLNNLAFVNIELENPEQAIAYYEIIQKITDDPNEIEMARQQIEMLEELATPSLDDN